MQTALRTVQYTYKYLLLHIIYMYNILTIYGYEYTSKTHFRGMPFLYRNTDVKG